MTATGGGQGPGPRLLNRAHGAPSPGAVSIMRDGPWGNPFRIGHHGTREQVVAKHARWFDQQVDLVRRLHELRGRDLVCCCAPLLCHGRHLFYRANGYYPVECVAPPAPERSLFGSR